MAISGMTGFARTEGAHGPWTFAVEARSVNGRNLEARYKGPAGFEGLERAVREGAQARFARGQVNVSVQARRADAGAGVRINREVLDRYLALGRELSAAGQVAPPTVDGLLALRGVLEADEGEPAAEERAALETAMALAVSAALEGLLSARRAEGAALAPVLIGVLDRIEALVAEAEVEAAAQPTQLKARFAARMAELVGEGGAPEERIVQEAAALAAKADAREELDRLASHVRSARELLADSAAVGRKLDFLSQEFMRESNTLCAKSGTLALTQLGLGLKAAVDQFREQIANVE
jgi:uncharacterized protein (TIGR00255 family)